MEFFGLNSSENFKRNRGGRATELLSPGCMNVNENPLLPLPPRLIPLKFWRRYRTSTAKDSKTSHCGRKRFRGWPRTFGFSDFSGVPRITRERIVRSSRNLVYQTSKQFYIFPKNFKPVPTMTFDLWPDFQGHAERNLRSVPFQRLKLANFGIFACDMDIDRCCKVTSMVNTDIVTFPKSTEIIRGQWPFMTLYAILGVFVPQRVVWCADFEFSISFSFIWVEIGSLG